jgi:hypothetical protein
VQDHQHVAMTLLTESLTEQLLANGRAQRTAMDNGTDALEFKPVVKLFSILRLAGPFALSVLARRRRVRGATPTAPAPASLRPGRYIHVPAFDRFDESLTLVENASDLTLTGSRRFALASVATWPLYESDL